MLRWTRHARDIIPMNLKVSCLSTTTENMKLLQQSLLYGKALEVVMKFFQLAVNEVDKLIETRKLEANHALPKAKECVVLECVSSSDVESVSANVYGASRSSAGMSDDEVMRIKAPPVPMVQGRPRTKQMLSLLDKIKMKNKKKKDTGGITYKGKMNNKETKECSEKKKSTKKRTAHDGATKITPHCSICRSAGHDKRTCPETKKHTSKANESMGT